MSRSTLVPRNEVYAAIDNERQYQDQLWGPTETEGDHGVTEFLCYIRDYTEEALHNQCRLADAVAIDKSLHSLRKIAALAIAAMEFNGVKERGYVEPNSSDLAKHGIDPTG